MPSSYHILGTSFFEKDLKRQGKKDQKIFKEIENLEEILESDPHNLSKRFDIKKLKGIKSGEGQFIHSDINRSKESHSREGRNPEKYWIPGQARNDKSHKTYFVKEKFI